MAQRYDFARFKTDIDLVRYAAHMGFAINQGKSTPTSKTMSNHADKVIISRKGGKWIYFSTHNDDDNGTIVQFIQNRTHQTLGQIGKELNNWIGGGAELPHPQHYTKTVAEKKFEPLRISNIYKRCKSISSHAYLEGRGLKKGLLSSPRFNNRLFSDRYNNAVFPHFNENGICALELKNADKGIFVTGSQKTLWRSNAFKGDHTLILSEAVIDALSYHALFAPENVMYGATGGGMSNDQAELIQSFVQGFTGLKTIILITDNDKGGDSLTTRMTNAIEKSGFTGTLKRHSPEEQGADWNDILNQHKEITP